MAGSGLEGLADGAARGGAAGELPGAWRTADSGAVGGGVQPSDDALRDGGDRRSAADERAPSGAQAGPELGPDRRDLVPAPPRVCGAGGAASAGASAACGGWQGADGHRSVLRGLGRGRVRTLGGGGHGHGAGLHRRGRGAHLRRHPHRPLPCGEAAQRGGGSGPPGRAPGPHGAGRQEPEGDPLRLADGRGADGAEAPAAAEGAAAAGSEGGAGLDAEGAGGGDLDDPGPPAGLLGLGGLASVGAALAAEADGEGGRQWRKWEDVYNRIRPHQSLAMKTPMEYITEKLPSARRSSMC